jgi:hypothetical protein
MYGKPGWKNLQAVTDDYESLVNLKLLEESTCINAGRNIADEVIRDFFGNEVPAGSQPDIGIHELK